MSDGPAVPAAPAPESVDAARSVGLFYASDLSPGLRRVRRGSGFGYLAADGRAITDPATLARIRALAIPPAWTDVWICPSPRGHLQAVGRDARRRKQYRYHARWREVRDETKYDQLVTFAPLLPRIRRRVARDLKRSGLPREKVLATVVRLLETTLVRVGNEEYARTNQSFGLTTMRDRHVDVSGHTLRFEFRGKSGRRHAVRVTDRRVARIVKACQDIPGQELFQYRDDDGHAQSIDSADVNAYLREIAGADLTAKLFRTWAGTVRAVVALDQRLAAEPDTDPSRLLVAAVKEVAERLGNTPAVCRACYIHPAVIEGHLNGTLDSTLAALKARPQSGSAGLGTEEKLTLAFLKRVRRNRAAAPRRRAGRGRAGSPARAKAAEAGPTHP